MGRVVGGVVGRGYWAGGSEQELRRLEGVVGRRPAPSLVGLPDHASIVVSYYEGE